jgi:imidazolonepropionase
VPGISIAGAAQILRPPADGLPYLRLDRAAELTTEPGSMTTDGATIGAFEATADAPIQIDGDGCAVIPGLVDCHTHLPFAGWRAHEYAQKIAGIPYEQIARDGGGIRSSARSFAQARDTQILAQARAAADEMLAHGTTTFECKSGYGLSIEQEGRALRLAAALAEETKQTVTSTALLAHAVPDGYDADGWMDVITGALPKLLAPGHVTALDIFVESVAFTNDHLRRMGELAKQHGLYLRAHVEQLSSSGSVPVALEAGARSVDHLACMPIEHAAPLAASETAAVLLPGAAFLGNEHLEPARELADAGAICALATDFNPGTSPVNSLPLIIGLAVRRYRWSVLEALLACTRNAAWVLDKPHVGSLEVGLRADILILDSPIDQIPYRFGHNPVAAVVVGGELVHVRPDQEWRISR